MAPQSACCVAGNGGMAISNLFAKASKLGRILALPALRSALFAHRVAAGVEHASALRDMQSVSTVVDIGANRGQFALAVRVHFPAAVIFSFEPLALPAKVYRGVFQGDEKAKLFESAIGPAHGESDIHLSARDDSSSLLPIAAQQSALFPGTAEVGVQRIRVARLSEHLPPEGIEEPALLKVDVQGFELQALAGCEDLLARFTWVYAECSFVELYSGQAFADEVIAWLRERGFALRGVYNMAYDKQGRAVQADFLFQQQSAG